MKKTSQFDKDLSSEFEFTTSRSSGPGGQNVDKVNTKVELRLSIFDSKILSQEEKEVLFTKLYHFINNQGVLVLTAQNERSQSLNKEIVVEKLYSLINLAFKPRKTRRKTRPTKASMEKRLADKQLQSQKKDSRKKPDTSL